MFATLIFDGIGVTGFYEDLSSLWHSLQELATVCAERSEVGSLFVHYGGLGAAGFDEVLLSLQHPLNTDHSIQIPGRLRI